jgi:purine-binding chemotaxis protein CheW
VQQFIGFRLHNGEYAVPIVKVREIINLEQITTLPNSPEYLEGMINIRGSVIPIINLKKLLHLPEDRENVSKIIVIGCGKITYGILIDSISGVVTIDEKLIDSSDDITHNGDTSFIDGIAKLDTRLIIILNTLTLVPLYDHALQEDATHEAMQGEPGKALKANTSV